MTGQDSRTGLRRRDPERTRRQIMDAALAEFADHGFHGARVSRITGAVGCNARLLYHYFGSQETTSTRPPRIRIWGVSLPPEAWIGPTEAFRMATEGSARILGLDRVGRIAPGWAADLLFLDRAYCHYVPLRDPMGQMVFAETGAALREVMIAGRTVFAGGRVLTLDEPALARQAEEAAARLDAANRDARLMADAAAVLVRSFCHAACTA